MTEIDFDDRHFELDERVYLRHGAYLTVALAAHLAAQDGITLTTEHWYILNRLSGLHKPLPIPQSMARRVTAVGS